MNSKDKAFLEKFCAEESSNLTGFENCRGTGFFIIAWFGWYSPYQSKIDQIFTHQSPLSKFYILMKALLPLLLLEMEHLSLKTKSCHKIFNNKMSQRFLGNLEKILPVVNIFYKDLQFMAMKVSCMQKILVPPLKFWKSHCNQLFVLKPSYMQKSNLLISVNINTYKYLTCCFESLWEHLSTST